MNKGHYIIDITGTQRLENDEEEVIDVTTTGNYTIAPTGNTFIRYKEYDNDNPGVSQNTTIKISDNQITITRNGGYESQLILELNKRHQCHYATPAGSLMIGVFTHLMDIKLNKNGGNICVAYTLDFDSNTVSENTFKIKVRKN